MVQLLYGDRDTVNVATGHPHEPQIAVSGIDHTIKIFSPDQAAQAEFRRQELMYREDYGMDHGGSRQRMDDEYKILSQNDASRDTGVQEALVTVSDRSWIISRSRSLVSRVV